jgi:SOS-response transcriptional repressor LexA
MPPSLTERQKECLEYIRGYIAENESSPRLEEIASYLEVTSPTAHNLIKALHQKGYLYFGRDNLSGFYIRLIERAGSTEAITEIPIAGKVNRYGEVYDFPKKIGHFATLLLNSKPENLFALALSADIPQENLLPHDLIICEQGIQPQSGDMCIAPIGNRQFLIQLEEQVFGPETGEKYLYVWQPIAHNDDTQDYFKELLTQQEWQNKYVPASIIIATALRLTRRLSY